MSVTDDINMEDIKISLSNECSKIPMKVTVTIHNSMITDEAEVGPPKFSSTPNKIDTTLYRTYDSHNSSLGAATPKRKLSFNETDGFGPYEPLLNPSFDDYGDDYFSVDSVDYSYGGGINWSAEG